MKKLLFTISFLIVTWGSYAQIFVEGGVSYNTFEMSDMKALQKELLIVPFETKATHSFEPFLGFQISVGRLFEKDHFTWRTGGIFTYTSTGGRIGYSDYSGILRGDQLLNLTGLGVLVGIEKNYKKWTFNFDLPITYDITSLTIKSELIINDATIDESKYNFHSAGLSIQPRGQVWRNFSSFSVGLTFGYQASIHNPDLVWSEDDESKLTLENSDKPLKAQWNGIRTGILFRYKFDI